MLDALKHHWPAYAVEALGLALFVITASISTTLLEHPAFGFARSIPDATLRHALLGLVMGTYIAALIYSPPGQQSGAHINPAVTWAFFRLGKIKLPDAIFYTLAQFMGAIGGAQLMSLAIGRRYAHSSVNYAVTVPGADGPLIAFVAEFIISFVLMMVVLMAMNSKRLEKLTGLFTGLLIAGYLAVEIPYSGMSLNPARSFGTAFTAGNWTGLWIYFIAPPLAALLAAECYGRFHKNQKLACAALHHNHERCIFCDQEGPDFPMEDEPKPEPALPQTANA